MIPSATRLRYALGYLELGLLEEADAELAPIPAPEKHSCDVLSVKLEINRLGNQWAQMGQTARMLIAKQPGKADWWISLAFATRRSTSVEAARLVLVKAKDLFPKVGTIYFNLGCYACVLGELDEAREQIARACALDADFKTLASTDEDLKPLWGVFSKNLPRQPREINRVVISVLARYTLVLGQPTWSTHRTLSVSK